MRTIKRPELSVYARIPIKMQLLDCRKKTLRFTFGTVENICRQYGIKWEKMANCIKFTAPKSRLQMFVEKLHFARVGYSENPDAFSL